MFNFMKKDNNEDILKDFTKRLDNQVDLMCKLQNGFYHSDSQIERIQYNLDYLRGEMFELKKNYNSNINDRLTALENEFYAKLEKDKQAEAAKNYDEEIAPPKWIKYKDSKSEDKVVKAKKVIAKPAKPILEKDSFTRAEATEYLGVAKFRLDKIHVSVLPFQTIYHAGRRYSIYTRKDLDTFKTNILELEKKNKDIIEGKSLPPVIEAEVKANPAKVVIRNYNQKQAAEYLGISIYLLRQVPKDVLPFVISSIRGKKGNKGHMYNRTDLDKYKTQLVKGLIER